MFYEVTEEELVALERGGVSSLYLNLGIFFLSTASSFLVTLCTVTFSSDRMYAVFWLVFLTSAIASLVLLVLWWRLRKGKTETAKTIRERLSNTAL